MMGRLENNLPTKNQDYPNHRVKKYTFLLSQKGILGMLRMNMNNKDDIRINNENDPYHCRVNLNEIYLF